MSKFAAFLKKNKKVKENKFYAPTKSMEDENGEPLKWEFSPMTSSENEEMRENYTYEVPIKGNPNAYRQKLNINAYIAQMIVKCTVVPDLYDKELQDSYGVKKPEDLLFAMVDNPGEYRDLAAWIQEFNGFDTGLSEKIEEAKN